MSAPDKEANATSAPATFSGHAVYGVHVVPAVGYRNDDACGTAIGDDAETEYMVASATVYNSGCCFDYGNVTKDNADDGEGSAEAVYFGSCTIWNKGGGSGPWVMADLENGLWAGDESVFETNQSTSFDFVTAMVKGDAAGKNHWTIKGGDSQSGVLETLFDGARPNALYKVMRKQGSIGLGIGPDNSSSATGVFFEGVMTAHYSSDTADDGVQANIVSAYGTM